MADRYFVEAPIVADRVALGGPEAHHLAHVMRARPGLEVMLFDGWGSEFVARVERTGRHEVELSIVERREMNRELPVAIAVGVALPKGERQKWLVEKLVELGAAKLVPLITARGVAEPGPQAIERLRRGVIEASKQCGRNRLMEILPPMTWEQWFATPPQGDVRLLADHAGRPAAPILAVPQLPRFAVWFGIGPEGGLTSEERAAATDTGWQPVNLGPTTLRVETAAIALLAIVASRSTSSSLSLT